MSKDSLHIQGVNLWTGSQRMPSVEKPLLQTMVNTSCKIVAGIELKWSIRVENFIM